MATRRAFFINSAIAVGLALAVNAGGMAAAAGSAGAFDAANATYTFAGDTFTLDAGKAQIKGHSGLPGAPDIAIPMGYTLATSAAGEIDGHAGEVAALYRNFGANLQWIMLFAVVPKDGAFAQIAADPAYREDASVQSLSVAKGVITVKLLVVGDADKLRPHYEQKLTQPLTLRFKVEDGAFVEVPSD